MAAIHLRRRLPDACSVLPGNGPGAHSSPIRTCSEWGLPSRPVTRRAGALLPHRFTLTPVTRGGLSLWHCPSCRHAWELPSTLAPVEPGLSSPRQVEKRPPVLLAFSL